VAERRHGERHPSPGTPGYQGEPEVSSMAPPNDADPKRGQGHSRTLDAAGRRRRARAASLARHQPDHPAIAAFRVEAAEKYIRELVDSLPPLTDAQRRRLAALLHPEGGADAASP
jgi:hypothetical protein